MSTASEQTLQFVSALARGELLSAEAMLYVSPLESHPMMQAVPPSARAGLVGVPNAARKESLRRAFDEEHAFWRDVEVGHVVERVVSQDAVEVYVEAKLQAGRAEWRCLLLQRMQGAWGVDELTRAIVERAVAYLPAAPTLNFPQWRAAFVRQFGVAEMEFAENGNVLRVGHLAIQLRRLGPDPRLTRFDHLSPEAARAVASHRDVLEVSASLDASPKVRWSQLVDFSRALWTFAATGAPAVYLPVSNVMEEASSVMRLLEAPAPDPENLAPFWVNFSRNERFHYTRGMSHFTLPELEVPTREGDESRHDLCVSIALHQLRSGPVIVPGNSIGPGASPQWRVVAGGRGPNAVETYGIWGSIRLQPA